MEDGRVEAESDKDLQDYALLILSDSNLPTGGFVASAGLESYSAHGFLASSALRSSDSSRTTSKAPTQSQYACATLDFSLANLGSYTRSACPFIADAHALVDLYCRASSLPVPVTLREKEQEGGESSGQTTSRDVDGEEERHLDAVLALLHKLDNAYHTLTLNHVARRASRAQGIALLTLYSKAFSGPSPIRLPHTSTASRRNAFDLEPESEQALDQREGDQERYRTRAAKLVDALKLRIRRGEHHGHLPICWATFSASLGLSKRRALHLHLFLQARALLSSSIRLNTLGPYLAHQLLLYHMRSILDSVHSQTRNCTTGLVPICTPQAFHEFSNAQATFTLNKTGTGTGTGTERQARTGGKSIDGEVDEEEEPEEEGIGWEWDWEDEGAWDSALGPATTWPVGEIVQGRHDQLHSRLFNS